MTLREKLIVLRDKAGISQMALAHQLGVSRQAVTRWESGDTTPSMEIYDVSLDWLCSDTADGKSLEEVVAPVEDNGISNATTSAENKKKIRYAVIALVAGVAILACMWLAMRPKTNEMSGVQFEDMENEIVDIPDQGVNGFDFEWEG